MELTPELKRRIRRMMKRRSPDFLSELKKRIYEAKMKKNDNAN